MSKKSPNNNGAGNVESAPDVTKKKIMGLLAPVALAAVVALAGCSPNGDDTGNDASANEAVSPDQVVEQKTSDLLTQMTVVGGYSTDIFTGKTVPTQEQADAINDLADAYTLDTTGASDEVVAKYKQTLASINSSLAMAKNYNVDTFDPTGKLYGSKEYLEAHPTFVTQLTANAREKLNTDGSLQAWNFRDKIPMDLFADPNGNGATYAMNLPAGTKIQSIKSYQPVTGGDWGQTAATGTVIDLGQMDMKNGNVSAASPTVETYIFNKANMSPAEFAASIKTTPNLAEHLYHPTKNTRFGDFWGNPSTDGLYALATWGNVDTGPGGWYNGQPVSDVPAINNDVNLQFDPSQFPDDYENVCWFGGQAFWAKNIGDKTVFTTYTFLQDLDQDGIVPDLNNPQVRKILLDFASSAAPQPVGVTDGTVSVK